MKQAIPITLILLLAGGLVLASSDGWRADYGRAAAQFVEVDLLSNAAAYDDKKITVQGKVKSVDTSDPKAPQVILERGTRADFSRLAAMALAMKPGETVRIDGILRVDGSDVLLTPAARRSHDAPFNPTKR